jgi:lipopolysaccharide transport system permease protein
MTEIVYDSAPELRRPSRFFRDALDDLTRSRGVAWQLFRASMKARHRRAWLGPLWLVLPSIATTAIWVYVQRHGVVAVATPGVPYPVYVLSGMVFWQVFTDALSAPLQQLATGKQIVTRSRVPHEALILAGVIEVFTNCGVRLTILAAALAIYRVPIAATAMLVPLGILALTILGLALGLFAAPAGMLYDDVPRLIVIATNFWFFLTPVVYRIPAVRLLRLNPVTPLLDATRAWLISGAGASGFVTATIGSTAALLAAWLFHRLARPHVISRLG